MQSGGRIEVEESDGIPMGKWQSYTTPPPHHHITTTVTAATATAALYDMLYRPAVEC